MKIFRVFYDVIKNILCCICPYSEISVQSIDELTEVKINYKPSAF